MAELRAHPDPFELQLAHEMRRPAGELAMVLTEDEELNWQAFFRLRREREQRAARSPRQGPTMRRAG